MVRAFYEATIRGHRESLRGLQSPYVVYDLQQGMPVGSGIFEGLEHITTGFLTNFYGAFDVHFEVEEYITSGEKVVAIGHILGKTRKAGMPVNVPFVHIWSIQRGYLQRLRAFTDTAVLSGLLENQ